MNGETPPPDIVAALRRMRLWHGAGAPRGEPLTGGVSSDIWRVELAGGPVCVKRALAKLNVAADWRAPVERNVYEARWMREANRAVPGCAPALLGQDGGTLAMAYLPADSYPLWKNQLRDGDADPTFAEVVGRNLARIHAATAARPKLADQFPTDAIFFDIRLEPYLLATAQRHPDRAAALHALVAVTQAHKLALVHGDVSPKNILRGPDGPVFLDAECAWWGDPAFDLAFCLNHLLLKWFLAPATHAALRRCFEALSGCYLAGVAWEAPDALERRAARLLPGLLLARVDGKSPVEYIVQEAQRDRVRHVARALLAAPAERLAEVTAAWREAWR